MTDKDGNPVFAYDFPYDYMYIAFSTPDLKEGETYHVYLGGEIEGEQRNGLYGTITAYTPGKQMKHGEGNAEQRVTMQMPADMGQMGSFDPMQGQQGMGGEAPTMPGMTDPVAGQGMVQQGGAAPAIPAGNGQMGDPMANMGGMMEAAAALEKLDLNEILKGVDLNELLKDVDLNDLLTGVSITELLTEEQIRQYLGNVDVTVLEQAIQMRRGFGGGMGGGMRGLQSSADVATTEFVLTRETTGFTNVSAVDAK